ARTTRRGKPRGSTGAARALTLSGAKAAISRGSAFIVVIAVAAGLHAQASKTRAHVDTLASARLEGRLAGSNGERLAGDYIVAELEKIGAKPLPGQQDFRLPFEFTAGTKDSGSTIRLRSDSKKAVEGGACFGCTR